MHLQSIQTIIQPYLAELGEERFRRTFLNDAKDFLREELNTQTFISLGLGIGMHALGQASFRYLQNRMGSAILAHAARIALPTLSSALLEGSGLNFQLVSSALGFEFSNLASQGLEIFLTGQGCSRLFRIFLTRTLNPLLFPLSEILLKSMLHCVGIEASPVSLQQSQSSDYFRYLGRDLIFSGLHHSAVKIKQRFIAPSSITAQLVAYARGVAHEQNLYGCSDPWAKRFCGTDALIIGRSIVRQKPTYPKYMAIRTRWLDRLVEQFSERHPGSQIVILGAGFDTRCARLKGQGRSFFEVDHPSTSRMKRRQVQGLRDYPGEPTYVECDFSRDCFLEKLRARGFNDRIPTLFIMEGVSMYLSDAALRSNIRKIRRLPRAVYAFDYLNNKGLQLTQATLFDRIARKNREKMVWGSDHPERLFAAEEVRARKVTFTDAARELAPEQETERWFGLYGFMIGGE